MNKSIGLNIYIVEHFSFSLNLFDSENISISIILNDIMLFFLTFWGLTQKLFHLNLFFEFDTPLELIWGEGAYCKKWALTWGPILGGLNRGKGAKSRIYSNNLLILFGQKIVCVKKYLGKGFLPKKLSRQKIIYFGK